MAGGYSSKNWLYVEKGDTAHPLHLAARLVDIHCVSEPVGLGMRGGVGRKMCTGRCKPSWSSLPRLGEFGPSVLRSDHLSSSVSAYLTAASYSLVFLVPGYELPEGQDAPSLAFVFLAPDFNTRPKCSLNKCLLHEPLKILRMRRTKA